MTNPPLNLHLHEITLQFFYWNRRQRLYFTCAEVRLCGDLHNTPAFWAYNSLHLVAIEGTLPPLDTFVL